MKKILFVLSLLLAGCGGGTYTTATVMEKHYTPSSTQTGFTSAGKSGGVVVTSTPESYTVIVKFDDGEVSSVDSSAKDYVNLNPGDRVEMKCYWFGCEVVNKK